MAVPSERALLARAGLLVHEDLLVVRDGHWKTKEPPGHQAQEVHREPTDRLALRKERDADRDDGHDREHTRPAPALSHVFPATLQEAAAAELVVPGSAAARLWQLLVRIPGVS
jgi:hypothetical protein